MQYIISPDRHKSESALRKATFWSILLVGAIITIAALHLAKLLLAPVLLAVIIGLVLGPVADKLETLGISSWISAIAVVILFLTVLSLAFTAVLVPLILWADQLPTIWTRVEQQLSALRPLINSAAIVQEEIRAIISQSTQMRVSVEDSSPMTDAFTLAPAIVGQIILFLATLFFFVATRKDIRAAALSLCIDRRYKFRIARIFNDVEKAISHYLIVITAINIGLGVAVGLCLAAAGVPSPFLWGALAGLLNYFTYIGPAIMAIILLGVGFASDGLILGVLTPATVFLSVNLVEAQFVTPYLLGRAVTLNPFIVFLSIVFWLWLWGPIGGIIAVPVLIAVSIAINRIVLAQPSRSR